MESKALPTISAPRSKPCESPSKEQLIRLWIGKFALNAGQALTLVEMGVTETLWLEGFDDLSYEVLEAAFRKALKVCKFWPVKIADIREHVTHAEENAAHLEAEQKWQQVLTYAQSTSPDYPSRPMKFKEQTAAAIRAAGGLDWIRDCPLDDLQWAKKRFIEAYVTWKALEKNQFLLPEGEVKNLIASHAQRLLPGARP